jgi:hypothetical protein
MNYVFNKIKFNKQIIRFVGKDGKKKLSINKKQINNKIIVRHYSQSSSSNSNSDPNSDPNSGPDPWKVFCFLGAWGLYHQYLNKKDIKRF